MDTWTLFIIASVDNFSRTQITHYLSSYISNPCKKLTKKNWKIYNLSTNTKNNFLHTHFTWRTKGTNHALITQNKKKKNVKKQIINKLNGILIPTFTLSPLPWVSNAIELQIWHQTSHFPAYPIILLLNESDLTFWLTGRVPDPITSLLNPDWTR